MKSSVKIKSVYRYLIAFSFMSGLAIPNMGHAFGNNLYSDVHAYLSLGYDSIKSERDIDSSSVTLNMVNLRLGGHFNKYFAVEGRIGFDAGTAFGSGVDTNNDSCEYDVRSQYLSGYAKVGNPLEQLHPYVMLGYFSGKNEISNNKCSSTPEETVKNNGISYGVGLEYTFTFTRDNADSVALEWMNFYSDDDADLTGFSLVYIHRFY